MHCRYLSVMCGTRLLASDQLLFLYHAEFTYLVFALLRRGAIHGGFPIDQFDGAAGTGIFGTGVTLIMLLDTSLQILRHASIKSAVAATDDIDAPVILHIGQL